MSENTRIETGAQPTETEEALAELREAVAAMREQLAAVTDVIVAAYGVEGLEPPEALLLAWYARRSAQGPADVTGEPQAAALAG